MITIATRRASRGGAEVAEITVDDNGPGFQRELIGQVFDPYVTTKAKGTGLGLAIVRKIVEEHGGHIEADNRAEGGASIRIDLPLTETQGRRRARARHVRAQERACMSTARILVVDDENDIRELVRDILSEEGYTVDTAANAAEARAACARQAPDLVLLDIWMPDTDGISLLREWQQSQQLDGAGRDDVRSRHGRDGGRGHAARRRGLRREAAVAGEAVAHRAARARRGQAAPARLAHAGAAADRAGRPQPR